MADARRCVEEIQSWGDVSDLDDVTDSNLYRVRVTEMLMSSAERQEFANAALIGILRMEYALDNEGRAVRNVDDVLTLVGDPRGISDYFLAWLVRASHGMSVLGYRTDEHARCSLSFRIDVPLSETLPFIRCFALHCSAAGNLERSFLRHGSLRGQ